VFLFCNEFRFGFVGLFAYLFFFFKLAVALTLKRIFSTDSSAGGKSFGIHSISLRRTGC